MQPFRSSASVTSTNGTWSFLMPLRISRLVSCLGFLRKPWCLGRRFLGRGSYRQPRERRGRRRRRVGRPPRRGRPGDGPPLAARRRAALAAAPAGAAAPGPRPRGQARGSAAAAARATKRRDGRVHGRGGGPPQPPDRLHVAAAGRAGRGRGARHRRAAGAGREHPLADRPGVPDGRAARRSRSAAGSLPSPRDQTHAVRVHAGQGAEVVRGKLGVLGQRPGLLGGAGVVPGSRRRALPASGPVRHAQGSDFPRG
jgi:hypothetical protein